MKAQIQIEIQIVSILQGEGKGFLWKNEGK